MKILSRNNRGDVKEIKFHHRVKRFYYKNLFRKIYTAVIIGLIGANIFSLAKYYSVADELFPLEHGLSMSAMSVGDIQLGGWTEGVDFETISIARPDGFSSTDYPIEGFTIMDRNLGASISGTTCNTSNNTGACGYLYQWGNNYGFPISASAGSILTGVGLTGDDSYNNNGYVSKKFVNGNSFDYDVWSDSSHHDGVWGGANDVNYASTKNSNGLYWDDGGDRNLRQGPCPEGWHVPSAGEWSMLLEYWYYTNYTEHPSVTSNLYYFSNSRKRQAFMDYFYIPFAGRRYPSDASLYDQGSDGFYWSSSPYSASSNLARYLYLSSSRVGADYNSYRAYGYSVRCFKNSYEAPAQKFDVTFEPENGSGATVVEVESGATATEPTPAPTRDGYAFSGWYLSGSESAFDFSTPITEDITLYAKWTYFYNDLELYYIDNNGTISGHYIIMDRNLGATQAYNQNWANQNSDSYGYYYKWGNNKGFTAEDSSFSSTSYGGSTTRTAGPCPDGYYIPTYTDLENLKNYWNNTNGEKMSSDLLLPPAGSRDSNEIKDFGSAGIYRSSQGGTSLWAYNIAYGLYFYSGSINVGSIPKDYGSFIRCFKNNPTQTLTLHPNGATNTLITFTGTVGNGRFITLDNPEKQGFIFSGWYDENDNKIEVGSTVVAHLYAKWRCDMANHFIHSGDVCVCDSANHYINDGHGGCVQANTLTFNPNGGTTTTGNITVESGSTINLSEYTASKSDHEFLGWNTDSGATVAMPNSYTVNTDIILYAIYRKAPSSWTTESGDFQILNITSTGRTLFTILDRNLGAANTGAGSSANLTSYGSYYQWGNNYGFANSGAITTGSNQVDASLYGPSNLYNGYTFIARNLSPYAWDTTHNYNLWGGQGDTTTARGVGTDIARRGPCPAGYHIPSTLEWNQAKNIRCQEKMGNEGCTSEAFAQALLLPYAGHRNSGSGEINSQGEGGYYWSSSRLSDDNAYYLNISSSSLNPQQDDRTPAGYSLRCFMNTSSKDIIYNTNGGDSLANGTAVSRWMSGSQLPTPTHSDSNKEFIGWYISSSFETGTQVTTTALSTDANSGSITLYAKWECTDNYHLSGDNCEINTYTVTFNANGGTTNTGSITVASGTSINLLDYTATKANYQLIGWNIDSGATVALANSYIVNDNTTLYAIYHKIPRLWTVESGDFYPLTVSNGTISFTIMDRNLGATDVAQGLITGDNNGNIEPENTLGYLYQWGNNYGFPNILTVKTSDTRVSTEGYGPNNYYSSSTFIKGNYNWNTDNNKNLWGGDGDTNNSRGAGTDIARRGPCPEGYHVPSALEWNKAYNTWNSANTTITYKGTTTNKSSNNSYTYRNFTYDLKLPFAGFREFSDGISYRQGIYGAYWSSSPHTNLYDSYRVKLDSSSIDLLFNNVRANGGSLRCFKNSTGKTLNYEYNGGSSEYTQPNSTVAWWGTTTNLSTASNTTRANSIFSGWYTTSNFQPGTKVTTNGISDDSNSEVITLYAKWECNPGYIDNGSGVCVTTYTVTFNSNEGSAITGQVVASGSTATQPDDPTRDGYTFTGWYENSDFSGSSFDFSTPITADITLYAKWGCPDGKIEFEDMCINPKDIVIQATSTAANQTLTINKYFANAYTVDWGDGSEVENLTADTTHPYATAGTYNIILTPSTDRWTFQNVTKPLVPTNGTTMTGIKIVYMPSLAEGFGDSTTSPGNYFFYYFNYQGALTSLPEGSFDTSEITTAGKNFFYAFNSNGALKSLPNGSFNTSKIMTVGDDFFSSFNSNGALTSLPEGSFNLSHITSAEFGFFSSFNSNGALRSLPEGSFNTSNIRSAMHYFFAYFNQNGALTSLPEGSFNLRNITSASFYFFQYFNYNGALTNLPDSFTINSAGASRQYSYQHAFDSSYTLNRRVFDLVGTTKPNTYVNAFSDNQPGRCGVNSMWLVSTNNQCNNTYYTVRFNSNGGSYVYPQTVTGKLIEPISTMSGAILGGWYTDVELTHPWNFMTDSVTEDITLYAEWKATVTYDAGEGGVSDKYSDTDRIGEHIILPGAHKSGNFFVGWNNDNGVFVGVSGGTYPLTRVETLYAWWSDHVIYVVTFDDGRGNRSADAQFAEEGESVTLPDAIQNSGYLFTGWYDSVDNGTKIGGVGDSISVNETMTLYAHWDCDEINHYAYENGLCVCDSANGYESDGEGACQLRSHTVTFDAGRGTQVNAQTVLYGSNATEPTTELLSYTLSGWYIDSGFSGEPFDFTTPITGDIKLYAKWVYSLEFEDLEVHFLRNNGVESTYIMMDRNMGATEVYNQDWYNRNTGSVAQSYTFGRNPSNSRGVINYWDGGCPEGYYFPTKPNWESIISTWMSTKYNLTDTGIQFASDLLLPGGTYWTETRVPDAGASFHWIFNLSSNNLSINSAMQDYHTGLVRCFKSSPTPKVELHANGWKNAIVTIDGNIIKTLGTPTKDHYIFSGWYDENNVKLKTGDIAPAHMYLRYECDADNGYRDVDGVCSNIYTITYDTDGGEWEDGYSPITGIQYGSTATEPDISKLIKSGYNLKGWYLSGSESAFDFTGTTITGNTTLYAKWECDMMNGYEDHNSLCLRPITITYHPNDGSFSGMNINQTIHKVYYPYDTGNKIMSVQFPNKAKIGGTGYMFDGWYRDITYTQEWTGYVDETTRSGTVYAKYLPFNELNGILNDGSTYTIMDRNLGAIAVATGIFQGNKTFGVTARDSLDTFGSMYIRGNNYGFKRNVNYGDSEQIRKPDTTGYGPGNYYSSATRPFPQTYPGPYNWDLNDNYNLWGDTTDTLEARRGPCPEGYHVPTNDEWSKMISQYGIDLRTTLRLPHAGGGASSYYGGYWTSSPTDNGQADYLLMSYNGAYTPLTPRISSFNRDTSMSIRCFKNVSNNVVRFDSNGGNDIEDQWIEQGNKAIKPSDPSLSGHEFQYWYLSGSEEEFLFDTTLITNNITTLYAKWYDSRCSADQEYDEANNLCYKLDTTYTVPVYYGVDVDPSHTYNDNQIGTITVKINEGTYSGDTLTIMDMNLGATTSGTTCSAGTESDCGQLYQRGNNAPVKSATSVTTKATFQNYWPGHPFSSGLFIYGYNDYWNPANIGNSSQQYFDGLWGGLGDDTSGDRGGIYNGETRQGPCPTGYHVPSIMEWDTLLQYFASSVGQSLTQNGAFHYFSDSSNSNNTQKFQNAFLLPSIITHNYSSASLNNQKNNSRYWSSSPTASSSHNSAYLLHLYSSSVLTKDNDYRANGYSVRCFKDSPKAPETLTLTFDKNGGNLLGTSTSTLDQLVASGHKAQQPVNPTPVNDGEIFSKWTTDQAGNESAFIFSSPITTSGTLYAQYICDAANGYREVNDTCSNIYTITWTITGNSNIQQLTYNSIPSHDNPTDYQTESTIYTFSGWTKNGVLVNLANEHISADVEYVALYDETPRLYTITWTITGNSNIQQLTYNSIPSHDNPSDYQTESTIYTFSGWTKNGVLVNLANEHISTDVEYVALYDETPRLYTITWTITGNSNIQQLTYNSIPSHDDPADYQTETTIYTFSGWTKNSVLVNLANEHISTDVEYVALYDETPRPYTIRFINRDDTFISSGTYHYSDSVTAPSTPSKPQTNEFTYSFAGWTPEIIPVTGDQTYKATFTENIRIYTVTFKDGDNTLNLDPDSAAYESKITLPAGPTKQGYIFNGWYKESTFDTQWSGSVDVITGDTIIYAKYDCDTANGYHANGTSCVKNQPSSSGGGGGGGGKTWSTTKDEDDKSLQDKIQEMIDDKNKDEQEQTHGSAEDQENTSENVTDPQTDTSESQTTDSSNNGNYTEEFKDAYTFAKSNQITTQPTIKEAKMYTDMTRIEMAKMMSYYAMNILGQTPDISKGTIKFRDVTTAMDRQYNNGVTLSYQLGIMGINMEDNMFRPKDKVTRAEFATALSRMLYKTEDGKGGIKYYEPHIATLYNKGIINNTNPKLVEKRGYVMTMLMRSAK